MQVPRDSHLEIYSEFQRSFITLSRVGSYQSTNSGLIGKDAYTCKFELPSLESISWSGPLQSACSIFIPVRGTTRVQYMMHDGWKIKMAGSGYKTRAQPSGPAQ